MRVEKHGDAETVVDAFRAAFQSRYRVACSLIVSPMQFMLLEQQLETHGAPALLEAVTAYFASQDRYVQKARHPLSLWLRDPLKYLAVVDEGAGFHPGELDAARAFRLRRYAGRCPHDPRCEFEEDCLERLTMQLRRDPMSARDRGARL